MPRLQFGASAYIEELYGLPSSVLENWYAESLTGRTDWTYRLIPTPGLVVFSSDVSGTLGRGCFQSDAIASGEIISVLTTTVYRISSAGTSTLITGAVVDDGKPVAHALSQSQAVLNSGGKAYTVTASAVTDFTANLTAAGAAGAIIDVAVINNRHLYAEDNSGRVFYSDPGAASTIGGFFTAERDPDQIRSLLIVGATIMAMGTRKTEFWTPTDSAITPFIQRQGFVLEYGVIGSRARAQIGGAAYWVAHDHTVRRWAGGPAVKISSPWIERLISGLSLANKALVRMTAHSWIGHEFVKLYIPGKGSYFLDTENGAWHRRRDLGDELITDWSYDYFVEAFGETYVQSLATGRLFQLDEAIFVENAITVRRVATATLPIERTTRVNNVIIEGQSGIGLDGVATQGSVPTCMLRASYDGHIFGDELQTEIGKFADYSYRPIFGGLGVFRPPFGKVELAYSDPVGWTVYGATFNERPS